MRLSDRGALNACCPAEVTACLSLSVYSLCLSVLPITLEEMLFIQFLNNPIQQIHPESEYNFN